MTSPQPYQYFSILNHGQNVNTSENGNDQPTHIRLLNLRPGEFEDPIEIDLDIVVLDPASPVSYEALSYVWGSAASPETIYVGDGKKFSLEIGQNLAVALRHLRNATAARKIWADAVCINQHDLVERGSQVANMGNIYRLSQGVIAWLGPEKDGSDHILDMMDRLGEKLELDPITREIKPSAAGKDEPQLATREHVIPIDLPELKALRDLFDRPWFDRLWIRQEIYLSHTHATVQVGTKTISWRNFSIAALRIFQNETESEEPELLESISQRLTWLQELLYHDSMMLESLRRTCGRCRCSDARDRVYAVMNMVPAEQKQIIGTPDYTLPPMEVWKRLVLSYIRHYQTVGPECVALLILDECTGQEPFDTPSWVPKWEVEDPNDPIRTFTYLGMSGSLITPHIEILPDDVLRLLGVRIQTIQSVTVIESRETLIPRVKEFMRDFDLEALYPDGETILKAFIYTLFGGHIQEATSPPRDDKHTESEVVIGIQAMFAADSPRPEPWDVLICAKFGEDTSDCLVGRCLVKTAEGYIGVAPRTAQTGDQVVVLAGGYSPVVLRPSNRGGSKYHLLGSCYVHGFMWLEAFLGPLPAGHHYVAHHEPGENYVSFKVKNSETGIFCPWDPRVDRWPILEEYLKAGDEGEFYTIDVVSDVNKKMGVGAEYFDII
jgi:heterokaryon incompatibility protein (HET)